VTVERPGPGAGVRFFDAHCDTVMKVMDGSHDFHSGVGAGHVSVPGLVASGFCAQVFACFVLAERCPGTERATAEGVIDSICRIIGEASGAMALALTGTDVRAACAGGPIAGLIALEGADPLEGKAESFSHFHRLGVRDLILAWKDNPFSGSAFGTNAPLTLEGEALVLQAEELGTMIDVSHLSDRAFADVCRIVRKPFIASHSNCRALCPSVRNLTDPMIRQLAERGGVMGINLVPGFLDPERARQEALYGQELVAKGQTGPTTAGLRRDFVARLPRVSLAWAGRHVRHAIQVGGEDCVGLGADLDGTDTLPMGMDGVRDYPALADMLLKAGLTPRQLEKVAWRNLERVFCDVLPG